MTRHVLIACPHLQREVDQFRDIFEGHGITIEVPAVDQQLTEAELLTMIDRFDGMVAGDDQLTARVLERATRLKVISKWGIGLDGIDLDAARAHGIVVRNTPGELGVEVAEIAVGYLVLLARQLHRIDRDVRTGTWNQIRGTTLAGKTLGIIGLGAAGSALARRAVAMEMHVIGHDPYLADPASLESLGVHIASFDTLIAEADYLSLNCPLTADNRHMIGAPQLATMKRGVRIVNTARGPLLDEAALVNALLDGTVAGAALDVFEVEPLPDDSPLRGFEQCIFGSHNCSNTVEAVSRVNARVVQNLLDVIEETTA